MHGLQLWIALPDDCRHDPPRFEHHPHLPVHQQGDATITVVAGEFAGTRSPARVHSPLVGAEVLFAGAGTHQLPVDPGYEHGVVVMAGTATVAGADLVPGSLLYLGPQRSDIPVEVSGPARLFLLGGEPFDEPLVMWWNFVGRSHDEIVRRPRRLDGRAALRSGHRLQRRPAARACDARRATEGPPPTRSPRIAPELAQPARAVGAAGRQSACR